MKATERYFYVVLFILLYKVVLTLTSVNYTLVCDHLIDSYWAVQYSHVVLFIVLYKVVLTFQSVDEFVVYNHSNKILRVCYCHLVIFFVLV